MVALKQHIPRKHCVTHLPMCAVGQAAREDTSQLCKSGDAVFLEIQKVVGRSIAVAVSSGPNGEDCRTEVFSLTNNALKVCHYSATTR
jgi:hypothetical protein